MLEIVPRFTFRVKVETKNGICKATASSIQSDWTLSRNARKQCDVLFVSTSNNNKGQRLTTRSISGIVKKRLKAAGYTSNRLTAHSLRHTAGTLNLMNGGTLEETQQLLRHSNINTTMIYLHHLERENNQSEKRIADALF